MYISNHFDIYTVDIHLYTPRLSENVRTYFVHTRGLTYTPSRLSLVYIINARCEPHFRILMHRNHFMHKPNYTYMKKNGHTYIHLIHHVQFVMAVVVVFSFRASPEIKKLDNGFRIPFIEALIRLLG